MSISLSEGDLKLFQELLNWSDVKIINKSFVLDNGIENYIVISLFTDARASDTDILPSENSGRRGWFGNQFYATDLGSKLWLLVKYNISEELFTLATAYIEDALQWMIDESIVDSFDIVVSEDFINENNILIEITANKDKESIGYTYYYNWQNQKFGTTLDAT